MSILTDIMQRIRGVMAPAVVEGSGAGAMGAGGGNGGMDIGKILQGLMQGQQDQHKGDIFSFGHSGKPMLRMTLGGQYEGDPNAKPEGLDAFYKMNPQVKAAHDAGQVYNGPNGIANPNAGVPAQGTEMFGGKEVPLSPEAARNGTQFQPNHVMTPQANGGMQIQGQYGTGTNTPVPGGGMMPIGQSGFGTQMNPMLEAMKRAQQQTGSSNPWSAFLPKGQAGWNAVQPMK